MRWAVNFHGREWWVNGGMAVINDNRRRWASVVWGNITTRRKLRRWEVDVAGSSRISSHADARVVVQRQGVVEAWRRDNGASIRCRMDILRTRCRWQLRAVRLRLLQELEALGNAGIRRVEFACAGIGVDGIRDLVVAAFIEAAEVEPHFGDVGVDPNGAGVSVECIAVLVDLEVENTYGAPERRVATVTVDRLLICFVRLVILLTRHVSAAQEVPTLSIGRVSLEAFGQVLNRRVLILEGRTILMIQPPKLLENLGMIGVINDHALISVFSSMIVLLLLEDVPDLEPNVGVCEWTRWVTKDAVEAFEGVFVLRLLFVNYAEAEEDFVCLVKVFVHSKDGGESFLGMIERAVTIIEDTDAVPEFGILLWVREEIEGLLVGRVRLLKVILHEIAVTESAPYFAVVFSDVEDALKVLNCLGIVLLDPSNPCHLCKARETHRVMPKGIFVRVQGVLEVAHLLGDTTDQQPCLLVGDVKFLDDGVGGWGQGCLDCWGDMGAGRC